MRRIALICALFCHLGYADSSHDWDHVGTSFMLQTALYGASRKAFHFDRVDAFLFSAVTTMMITTVYSLNSNTTAFPGRDVGMNAIGVGLSVGTCLIFDF